MQHRDTQFCLDNDNNVLHALVTRLKVLRDEALCAVFPLLWGLGLSKQWNILMCRDSRSKYSL